VCCCLLSPLFALCGERFCFIFPPSICLAKYRTDFRAPFLRVRSVTRFCFFLLGSAVGFHTALGSSPALKVFSLCFFTPEPWSWFFQVLYRSYGGFPHTEVLLFLFLLPLHVCFLFHRPSNNFVRPVCTSPSSLQVNLGAVVPIFFSICFPSNYFFPPDYTTPFPCYKGPIPRPV